MTVHRCHLLLLLPVLLVGCKSADKGGPLGFGMLGTRDATPASAGSQRAAVDPILTNGRIPPQDLPVPGKEGYAGGGGRDPLFGLPASRDDRPDRTAGATKRTPPTPKPTESGAVIPPKASVPYRPSPATAPAALASRIDPNDPAFRVGDDHPPLVSIGRGGRTAEELTRELKKLGATVGKPSLERGVYVARGEAELDPEGRPGVRRAYEATGSSPAVALKELLEQIAGDVKR